MSNWCECDFLCNFVYTLYNCRRYSFKTMAGLKGTQEMAENSDEREGNTRMSVAAIGTSSLFTIL